MESSEAVRHRLPVWGGLILSAMMIAGFVLDIGIFSSTGAEPVIRLEQLGTDLLRVQGSAVWPIEGWTYTLMILPAFVFVLGVYWFLRDGADEGLPIIGATAAVLFWVFHTMHNVAILTVVTGLAPSYVLGAPDAAEIETVSRGFIVFSEVLFLPGGGVGSLFWAVASLALGKAILETKQLPRWLGYTSIGVALLALLGLLQYAYEPFVVFGLIGWVLFIIWTAGVSVMLLRRQDVTTPQAQPEEM